MSLSITTTPWKPASQVTASAGALERARRTARRIAGELGHILSAEWADDTRYSSLTECLVCEHIAAVDITPDDPETFVGRALTRVCSGPAIW